MEIEPPHVGCYKNSIPHRHLQRLVAALGEALNVIFPLDVVREIAAAIPARAEIIFKWLADFGLW